MAATPHELELQEAGMGGGGASGGGNARVYALTPPEEGEGEEPPAARMQPLPLVAAPHQCSVRVAYWEQVGTGGPHRRPQPILPQGRSQLRQPSLLAQPPLFFHRRSPWVPPASCR
jgi:hypothetical protein